jgi:bacteriocin-like protein
MSDQSNELAKLKQQIVDEVSAKHNANSAELNEEELESITGGQDSSHWDRMVNHNMGVRTVSAGNQDFTKIVNMNMGVRTMKTDE